MFALTTSTVISTSSTISIPASLPHSIVRTPNNEAFFNSIFIGRHSSKLPLNVLLLGNSSGVKRFRKPIRPFSPVMTWQDFRVKVEVDVPCSVAYKFFSDHEATPHWMPMISSVKVLKERPELSRWLLKHEAFGHEFEFSWLARIMQSIPNRKIHWHSLEGLPNKGAVRFYPRSPSSCIMELNLSYEVPPILFPIASTVRPILEGMLLRGLERFAKVVKYHQKNSRMV